MTERLKTGCLGINDWLSRLKKYITSGAGDLPYLSPLSLSVSLATLPLVCS